MKIVFQTLATFLIVISIFFAIGVVEVFLNSKTGFFGKNVDIFIVLIPFVATSYAGFLCLKKYRNYK